MSVSPLLSRSRASHLTSSSAHPRFSVLYSVQRGSVIVQQKRKMKYSKRRKERWQIRQAFHQPDEQSSIPANQMTDKRCHVESSWSWLGLVIPWISRQDWTTGISERISYSSRRVLVNTENLRKKYGCIKTKRNLCAIWMINDDFVAG